MYLKKLTISGFKSFAGRTVIEFDRGIAAIVGPNGSGKSNIVEAIRWALGEQSAKQLRTGGREELVFAGTDGRARASMAEVILTFDNADGVLPLELGEVEIARRLYRSGETEYRLAGRTVRLADVQVVLAEGGVGAGSYAVVGQGMIDQMLLSSPAERKLLFEEASGIRSLELKRAAAQRKLDAAAGNLTRLKDILGEVEPRLAGLQAAAAKAEEVADLKRQLESARLDYLAAGAQAKIQASQLADDETGWRQQAAEAAKVITRLEAEREQHQQSALQADLRRQETMASLDQAESARQTAANAVTQCRVELAELEVRLSALKPHRSDHKSQKNLDKAKEKLSDIRAELELAASNAHQTQKRLDAVAAKVTAAQNSLSELRASTRDGSQQQFIGHALEVMRMAARHLDQPDVKVEDVRLLIHKAGRLLSHASKSGQNELLQAITKAQTSLESLMNERETLTEHYTNLVIAERSLEIDLGHQERVVQRLEDEVRGQAEQTAQYQQLLGGQKQLVANVRSAEADLKRQEAAVAALRQETAAPLAPTGRLFELADELEKAHESKRQIDAKLAEIVSKKSELADALALLDASATGWKLKTPEPKAGNLEEARRQVAILEERLEVHQQALAGQELQYQEVNNRHAELVGQIADLERAQSDLEAVVKRLEEATSSRFEEGFANINVHFERYFQRLFDGGHAQLKLERQDDGGYGIQIKATPAGKRLASLASLSGGERSLAGVALLAAILATSPSPFIVMDEVDAALDEANSGRLAAIFKELGRHSQLIVVTHNRQTMAAAHNLYGVTMDKSQVSKVLSLRLEEARQLAAR